MAGARGLDHGFFHDPARHHDRERGNSRHERGAQHHTRPDPVGAQRVRARVCGAPHHGGATRRSLRPAQPVRDRTVHLHHRLGAVRSGSEPGAAHRRPRPAGSRRRAAHAADAGDPDHDLSAGAARRSVRHLGWRGRARDRRWTDGGRGHHHVHRLALDLLHQRANRHRGPGRHLCTHP